MRILSLRARNFRQHVDTALEFGKGITAIIGPNGSGKSTILEAIAWAIYGTAAIRGVADSIRWKHAKPRSRVEVELCFELDGHEYRVVRSLHHAEVFVDGANTPAASGKDGVSEYLEQQLGMSREEFFNTYFTGQQELEFLAGLKGIARGHFLSRVLGYERLKDTQDALRQSRNALRNEIDAIRQSAGDPEAAQGVVKAAEQAVAEAERAVREAEQERDRLALEVGKLTPKMNEAEDARRKDESLRMRAEAAIRTAEEAARTEARARQEIELITKSERELEQLRAITKALPDVEAEVRRWEEAARAFEHRNALRGQLANLDHEIQRAAERLERLQQAPGFLAQFQEELNSLKNEAAELEASIERERDVWDEERRTVAARIEVLRNKVRELDRHIKHIKEAGADGACAMCARPLGGDFVRVLETLEDERQRTDAELKTLRVRESELRNRPATLIAKEQALASARERIQNVRAKIVRCEEAIDEARRLEAEQAERRARRETLATEIENIECAYDAAQHHAAKTHLEVLREKASRAQWLEELIARRPEWERELSDAVRRRKEAEQDRRKAETERTALAFDLTTFEKLRAEHERAIKALRHAELRLAEVLGEQRLAEERLKNAKSELERILARQSEIEEHEDRLRHYNELDVALTELRRELNDRIRPELSEIASTLIAELTDGRYDGIELDNNYEIVVLEHGEPRPVISGGEEAVANLALRLALSQMVADRAGRTFSLLVLDEVFGSLDHVRRDNVLRMLRSLGQRFAQILLITHVDEIREAADQVIRLDVEPKTGASIARMISRPHEQDNLESIEAVSIALSPNGKEHQTASKSSSKKSRSTDPDVNANIISNAVTTSESDEYDSIDDILASVL